MFWMWTRRILLVVLVVGVLMDLSARLASKQAGPASSQTPATPAPATPPVAHSKTPRQGPYFGPLHPQQPVQAMPAMAQPVVPPPQIIPADEPSLPNGLVIVTPGEIMERHGQLCQRRDELPEKAAEVEGWIKNIQRNIAAARHFQKVAGNTDEDVQVLRKQDLESYQSNLRNKTEMLQGLHQEYRRVVAEIKELERVLNQDPGNPKQWVLVKKTNPNTGISSWKMECIQAPKPDL